MPISKELFLAILSMDAYNRGYGAWISDGQGLLDGNRNDIDGLGEAGSAIGISIVQNVPLPVGSQTAGFYAVAYTVNGVEGIDNGTTVVSCRGS